MPIIHHPMLLREMEVSEKSAEILTTVPRVPWKRGPLKAKRTRPTAANTSPSGDTNPVPEKED